MGKVSFFIIFSSILLLADNILGVCCDYAINKGNNYHALRGDGVDGLPSTHMDRLLYLTMNGSHPIQQYNVKDATQQSGSMINYVYPELYGDSKTHFYVYWTRDGYQKTGCYNLKCPGYVPEANVPIVPGITIDSLSEPGGVKRTIICKIFKDSTGDWLLHVGFNSEPYLVGRFPKSLFTTLSEKADAVRLAGFAVTRTTNLVPMGSGFLPDNTKAASFSDIQLIDQNGVTSKVQKDQPVVIVDKKVYSASPISNEGKFTYGRPWE
ncbi:hypothetical protein EJB05_18649, partial [Eragrostis curvula]